jgi:hypothetical protein
VLHAIAYHQAHRERSEQIRRSCMHSWHDALPLPHKEGSRSSPSHHQCFRQSSLPESRELRCKSRSLLPCRFGSTSHACVAGRSGLGANRSTPARHTISTMPLDRYAKAALRKRGRAGRLLMASAGKHGWLIETHLGDSFIEQNSGDIWTCSYRVRGGSRFGCATSCVNTELRQHFAGTSTGAQL